MILNFSYGSNLLLQRMRERVPSAEVLGRARLDGYALRWHKRGTDGSGKCDIVEVGADSCVHGVVYRMARADKPLLDQVEGLGQGYTEREVDVEFDGRLQRVWTYTAIDIQADLPPWCWYHALVLAGARQQQLPDSYISAIAAVPALPDPDRQRALSHAHLLAGH